jgi:hypothetical protein
MSALEALAHAGKRVERGAIFTATNVTGARLSSCSSHSQRVALERKKGKEGKVGESSTEPSLWLDAIAGSALARGHFSLQRPPWARDRDGRETEENVARVSQGWAVWLFFSSEGHSQPSDQIRRPGRPGGLQ